MHPVLLIVVILIGVPLVIAFVRALLVTTQHMGEKRMVYDRNYKSDAHYNLGYMFGSEEMYDEAIEQFNKAIKINPNHAGAHDNLGAIYFIHGRLDEAIAEHEAAINIDPTFPDPHYNLGVAYKAKNDLNRALQSFIRFRELLSTDEINELPDLDELISDLEHEIAGQPVKRWREESNWNYDTTKSEFRSCENCKYRPEADGPASPIGCRKETELIISPLSSSPMQSYLMHPDQMPCFEPSDRDNIPDEIEAVMEKYNISYDGNQYVFQKYKYDKLEDAVNYAEIVYGKHSR